MTNRHQFVISVMSRDRVGIVRDVATAISQLSGDIADLSQTVLRGYFTMILFASFPTTLNADRIKQKLADVNLHSPTPLEISVRPVPADSLLPEPVDSANSYILTASGPDRIGFVADVSAFCAEQGINILDLSTKVDGQTYIMVLLVDLTNSSPVDEVRRRIKAFSQETGLNVTLQHHDIFKATNEINM